MFRLNLIGAALLFGCALVGFALTALGLSQRWSVTIALGLMVGLDLAYRLRHPASGRDMWLGPASGGFLALAPVWVMGLVFLVAFQFGLLD